MYMHMDMYMYMYVYMYMYIYIYIYVYISQCLSRPHDDCRDLQALIVLALHLLWRLNSHSFNECDASPAGTFRWLDLVSEFKAAERSNRPSFFRIVFESRLVTRTCPKTSFEHAS